MATVRLVPLPATSGAVTGSASSYFGFSIYNTSASAAATVLLYDGASAAGDLIETVTLGANESAREDYPNPIRLNTAIYAVITGTVTGVVRVG
jgi:hypothetical protein